jgi:hypothetical protein
MPAFFYNDRPVVLVHIGGCAEGEQGVRYTDVPQYEQDPHFPQYLRPTRGSIAVVPVASIKVAA